MKPTPLILAAFAAILLAAGVYAMTSMSGNTVEDSAVVASGSTCELSVTRGKSLDEHATGDVAAFRPLEEPLDLKEIAFVDVDQNPKSLADWQGKLVLFNLWATWCPPCREEMPYFEELQVKKADDNFAVIPVSIDLGDATKPRRFYDETGLKELPFFHDNTMEAFQILKRKAVALGMPTTLLVDHNGCGLGVLNGPAHWASSDAIALIDAAIGLPPLE